MSGEKHTRKHHFSVSPMTLTILQTERPPHNTRIQQMAKDDENKPQYDSGHNIHISEVLQVSNNFITYCMFNGTFSTVRLHRALTIYSLVRLISVKQLKILRFGECNNMCES